MDIIEIKNLEIFSNYGVFPEENVLGQKFVVSAKLYTSTRKAGLTDELTASIHYGEVSQMITKFTKEHTYKLLETLAENLCQMLLHEFPLMNTITLRIEKPWAPVGLPLDTVAVEITRGWHTAYVAFGSNLGDKKKYIDNGIQGLRNTPDCEVEAVSEYLVTEPYGGVEQDEFLQKNCLTVFTNWRLPQTENASSTGGLVPLIWTFCFMTMKSLIPRISIFLILIWKTAILC